MRTILLLLLTCITASAQIARNEYTTNPPNTMVNGPKFKWLNTIQGVGSQWQMIGNSNGIVIHYIDSDGVTNVIFNVTSNAIPSFPMGATFTAPITVNTQIVTTFQMAGVSNTVMLVNSNGVLVAAPPGTVGQFLVLTSTGYSPTNKASMDVLTLNGTGTGVSVETNLYLWGDFALTNHILAEGLAAPAIAAGTGAGTGPTVSVTGSDTAGQISIASGTLPSVSATIVTLSFTNNYPSATYPIIWPANAAAATLGFLPYVSGTKSNFTMSAGTIALGGSTTYLYNYHVIGR